MEPDLPVGWRELSLGDAIELKRGYDLPKRLRRAGPVPIVSSSGPSGWHDEAKVKAPGVVAGRYGTIGKVFYVQDDFWPLNTALYVRDFKSSHPRFVSYFLQTIRWEQYTDKAAVPGVNRNHVHMERVAWPPETEQHRIAAVLGALDDKIELNRKINRTLEEMAQAIFKSWFIDFAGVPPEDLVESGIGPIPRSWSLGSVADVANLVTSSVSPREDPDAVWEHYSLPAFDEGQRPALDRGSGIKSGKYRVPTNAVLVSKLNPTIPRTWMPELSDPDHSVCSTEFMPFEPRGSWRAYLYDLFVSAPMREAICSKVTGSTGSRQRVRPTEIAHLPLGVPPESVLESYERTVGPMHQKRLSSRAESATLGHLRDTLLPKLISGEIRVPELGHDAGGNR